MIPQQYHGNTNTTVTPCKHAKTMIGRGRHSVRHRISHKCSNKTAVGEYHEHNYKHSSDRQGKRRSNRHSNRHRTVRSSILTHHGIVGLDKTVYTARLTVSPTLTTMMVEADLRP